MPCPTQVGERARWAHLLQQKSATPKSPENPAKKPENTENKNKY